MTGGYSIREVISMDDRTPVTIELTAKAGNEPCNIDVTLLHDTLFKMPAVKYLELYRIMTLTLAKYNPSPTQIILE